MIESIEIENLRGIRHGKVERLASINVVVGPNNSGKSTLLEGLLVLSAHDLQTTVGHLLSRGGAAHTAFKKVFRESTEAVSSKGSITVDGTVLKVWGRLEIPRLLTTDIAILDANWLQTDGNGSVIARVSLRIAEDGRFSPPVLVHGAVTGPRIRLVALTARGTLEEALTQIENTNASGLLIEALKTSLVGLTDLRILKLGDDYVLHARIGDAPPIPVYLLGDGAKRLIFLAAGIFAKKGEVVLLEEPEAFQHPRYLTEIVRLLVTYASKGAQYVLTTHSIEFVDLLLDELAAWKDRGAEPPSLAVHRTRLVDGELYVTTLDGEQARVARQDLLGDLRG